MKQVLEENIDYLRCPNCHSPLDAGNGKLICTESSSHFFDALYEIPSFVETEDFEAHWGEHGTDTIPRTKIDTAKKFLQPAFSNVVKHGRWLDVGCGDGVHAVACQSKCPSNLTYFGVDISSAALLTASKHAENSCLFRADARNLPFTDDTFDVVFSYGVLGYTGAPEQALREMARVLKPDGLLGLWLAPRETGLKGVLLSSVRKICNVGGRHVTSAIANAIVPFLPVLPVASGVNLANASWKQCKEIVLVNIQPEILIYPTRDEVISWVSAADLSIVKEDENNPITVWARLSGT